MYDGFYLAIYVHRKLYSMMLLQLILKYAFVTIFRGVTRGSDYKHHWSDVIDGFVLTIITAVFTSRFCCVLYSIRNDNQQNREDTKIKNLSSFFHQLTNLSEILFSNKHYE